MIYITDEDLITDSQERLLNESTAGVPELAARIEKKVIAEVITMIGSRYNTDLIFNEAEPLYNEVLADIISAMTIYRIYKRNAARKITETVKNEFDRAIKKLEKINSGVTQLSGLPLVGTTESGKPDSDTIWGNFSNEDFYI
jgi:phage gp36-like protein